MSNNLNWISFNKSSSGWQAELLLEPDLPAFSGHFPGQPIFPGIAQIEVVLSVLSFGLHMPLLITHVPFAKFKAAISPNEIIQIHVTLQEKNSVRWLIAGSLPMFSTGELRYVERNKPRFNL